MIGAVSFVTIALAGCGGNHGPGVSANGGAVLRDFTDDGKLEDSWSCGSLRAALVRVPGGDGESYAGDVIAFVSPTARACDDAFATVHSGMTHEQVRVAFGKPSFVGRDHCQLYEWPQNKNSTTHARVCFARDHVTWVQVAT